MPALNPPGINGKPACHVPIARPAVTTRRHGGDPRADLDGLAFVRRIPGAGRPTSETDEVVAHVEHHDALASWNASGTQRITSEALTS